MLLLIQVIAFYCFHGFEEMGHAQCKMFALQRYVDFDFLHDHTSAHSPWVAAHYNLLLCVVAVLGVI